MFRHTILSAALALAALTGLANVPAASAHPPVVRPGHFARFEVQVRHRGHWDVRGVYRDRDDARRAARHLRMQGFDVRVERI